MPTPTLPLELIDRILLEDVLSDKDLAACCLLSKAVLPFARRALYVHVIVELDESTRGGDFYNLVTPPQPSAIFSHRHLGPLVREFTLSVVPASRASLRANEPMFPWLLQNVLIRWEGVTTVKLDSCVRANLADWFLKQPHTLSRLESLALNAETPVYALLPYLPNLKHFHLEAGGRAFPSPPSSLSPIPTLSTFTLKSVHTSSAQRSPETLSATVTKLIAPRSPLLRAVGLPFEILSAASTVLSSLPDLAKLEIGLAAHTQPANVANMLVPFLPKLRSLSTLSFHGSHSAATLNLRGTHPLAESTFIASFPPTLFRLNFRETLNPNEALDLVRNLSGSCVGAVGMQYVSPGAISHDTLSAACETDGIAYYRLEDGEGAA
ncbi:hypothetical protein JCM10213v2_007011 [Rhodosporidiobolus nylandii]